MVLMRVFAEGVLKQADVYLDSDVANSIGMVQQELADLRGAQGEGKWYYIWMNEDFDMVEKLDKALDLAVKQRTDMDAYGSILNAANPCLAVLSRSFDNFQESRAKGGDGKNIDIEDLIERYSSAINAVSYLITVTEKAAREAQQRDQPAQDQSAQPVAASKKKADAYEALAMLADLEADYGNFQAELASMQQENPEKANDLDKLSTYFEAVQDYFNTARKVLSGLQQQ